MSTPAPILQYTLNNKDLLPAGYTPIAYLLSDGNLWINTGVTISGNVYAQGKVVTTDTSGERDWIGNYNNSTSGGFVVGQYSYKHYVYSSNGGSTNNGTIEANVIYEHYASLTSSKGEILANGISYTGSARNVTVTNTVTLFRRGDSNCYWKGKVYFARLWQDNTLKGDWRPCIQDSNGVIGMYDLVSRTFKTNSGSGSFIAGPELAVGKGGGKSLPEEYLLVEYLESTGTLYINTGLVVTSSNGNSYDFEASVIPTALPSSAYYCIAGVDSNTQVAVGTSGKASVGNATSSSVFFSVGTQAKVSIKFASTAQTYYVNGTSTGLSRAINSETNIYLFSSLTNNYFFRGKIQYAKFGIARFFIPCYRKSDMKPGMYDTVNGVFYTNAGSGEFILGPSITNCYTWEPNAGSYGGENILGTKTNSRGKRCDELTSVVVGSSGSVDCAAWYNITEVYRGDTFTVSFDVKADIAMTAYCFFHNNTSGVVQVANGKNHNSGGTTTILDGNIAISVTTSWQRFTITWTMRTSGTQCLKSLIVGRVSGDSTNNGKTIYVKNVKVQRGESVNATFDSYPGFYTNVSSVYDSDKGWVADFATNTSHLSSTIPAVGNNFSVAWWELSSNFNGNSMPWGIYPFNPLYSKCLNTGDGGSNPWYKPETTTAIDNITNSTWHHFVVTGNGSANYLYVDGVKYGLSKTFKGLTGTSLVINGFQLSTSYCRNPKISNFQIFNVTLTDAQVKELYGK